MMMIEGDSYHLHTNTMKGAPRKETGKRLEWERRERSSRVRERKISFSKLTS